MPSLSAAFTSPEAKRRHVRRLFATIADRYDLVTRVLSYGHGRALEGSAGRGRWRRAPASARSTWPAAPATSPIGWPAPARRCAASTSRRGCCSWPAPRRHRAARCTWTAGDMTALPFADRSFDVVTTGYGLRNVPDLDAAVAEIARVLRPGGRFASLDFNRPESPVVRAAYLGYLEAGRRHAGLGAARRARRLSLHPGVDPPLSGRPRCRRSAGARQACARLSVRPLLGGLMSLHVGGAACLSGLAIVAMPRVRNTKCRTVGSGLPV